MTTYYLDPVNGNDASDGLSWATAWKTLLNGPTFARLGQTDSDEIRMAKSPDPVSLGDATWTHNADKSEITVSGCSNITVDNCESGWTAGIITPTYTTSYNREGTASLQAVMSSTNGKVCYKTIISADYSAHSRITFWVNLGTAANYTAGCPIQIRLCSDTAGDTAVDTFTIPSYYFPANYWIPITLDKGSALGSDIQSVALWTTSAVSNTIRIDNISVAKGSTDTTSLTLTDLIAKDNGNGEYFPISYINGTTVSVAAHYGNVARLLEGQAATVPFAKYYSINGTETITTLKRACFSTAVDVPATATSTAIGAMYYTNSNVIGGTKTYKGGYNTATDTVDGETWFDGITGYGFGILRGGSGSYNWTIDRVSAVRYYVGLQCGVGDNAGITNLNVVNNYKSFHIEIQDFYTTNQYRFTKFNIDVKWMYCGVGSTTMTTQQYNNAWAAYTPLPQLRPGLSVANAYNRSAVSVLASTLAFDFTTTGTVITCVPNTGNAFAPAAQGIMKINNCLIVPPTSSLYQTYYLFSAAAPEGNTTYIRNGSPSRIFQITGVVKPVQLNIFNQSTLALISVAAYNNEVLVQGTTSNAFFGTDTGETTASIGWTGMSVQNSGIVHIDNLKTNVTLPTSFYVGAATFGGVISFTRYNQDANTNRVFTYMHGGSVSGGKINYWETQTDVTYNSSASAWRKYWGSDCGFGTAVPDSLIVGTAVVKAGSLVTITIRARRTAQTVFGYLMVDGGYAGLASNGYMATTSGANGDWELLSISFTPDTNAVIPIHMGTLFTANPTGQSVYFDDLQISQA